jgi:hypothetical protein
LLEKEKPIAAFSSIVDFFFKGPVFIIDLLRANDSSVGVTPLGIKTYVAHALNFQSFIPIRCQRHRNQPINVDLA